MRRAMTEISPDTGIDGNVAEYSVGEISQAVQNTLEGTCEPVRGPGPAGRPTCPAPGDPSATPQRAPTSPGTAETTGGGRPT